MTVTRGKSEKKSGVPIMLKYDFIILGATGFTGRWVLEEEYVPFDLDINLKRHEMTLVHRNHLKYESYFTSVHSGRVHGL